MPPENIVSPDVVRRLCWDWQSAENPEDTEAAIDDFLREAQARRWQRDLVVPVLTEALTTSGEMGQSPADTLPEG